MSEPFDALPWQPDDDAKSARIVKQAEPSGLGTDRFDGPAAFKHALYDSMAQAVAQGWPQLCWIDPDFSDWPLAEREFINCLQAWSGPQRQLILIAQNYRRVQAECARFVAWRQAWSHLIEAWEFGSGSPPGMAQFPSVFLGQAGAPSDELRRHWVLHRFDLARMRGVAAFDSARHKALQELQQDLITRSKLGFPAFALGL
jgi:hypothetical protein